MTNPTNRVLNSRPQTFSTPSKKIFCRHVCIHTVHAHAVVTSTLSTCILEEMAAELVTWFEHNKVLYVGRLAPMDQRCGYIYLVDATRSFQHQRLLSPSLDTCCLLLVHHSSCHLFIARHPLLNLPGVYMLLLPKSQCQQALRISGKVFHRAFHSPSLSVCQASYY